MSEESGRLRRLPRPELGRLRRDAVAGVPGAIASVPDAMASAALVGINPVYGLYAGIAGPVEHLRRTRRVDVRESVTVVPGASDLGGSTLAANRAAEDWLRNTSPVGQ